MEPAPKPELPQKPAAEVKHPAAPKKDAATEAPMSPPGTPRRTLEEIAAGKSVAEATKGPDAAIDKKDALPNREMVSALLNESNVLLLDMKDSRLWMSALATQAADTPLGNEVRLSALRSMMNIPSETLPPELANQVTELQAKIKALNIPEAKPEESSIISIIDTYNEAHPETKIPQEVVDKIKTGSIESGEAVAKMLQSNPDLGKATWKELTGMDEFTGLSPTPEAMLDLAGIPQSPENLQKAQEIFGNVKAMKEPGVMWESVAMNFMYFALFIQFFNSVALGEGGGGGH